MQLKQILSKLSLQFHDLLEEQEYQQIKLPLIKDFFKYLFVTLTAILIPYSIRYFIKQIFPQNVIIVVLIVVAACIFLIQRKLEKYLDYLLLGYLVLIIAIFATVYRQLLPEESNRECFYMGYAFAMIHRLVGYRVLKFQHMIALYVVSLSVKLPLIWIPDLLLCIIVILLDIVTVALGLKSEKVERDMFDSLYKTKKDIVKFKQLLTQYLPNQMAIFSNDYNEAFYMNNAFKRTFKCPGPLHMKEALGKLIIERETIEKHRNLFSTLGFILDDSDKGLSLSSFMTLLGQNSDMLRDMGVISIPVIEDDDDIKNDSMQMMNDAAFKERGSEKKTSQNSQNQHQVKTPKTPKSAKVGLEKKEANYLSLDPNESLRSSDRGSSKSYSSDIAYEEGRKRVFKVKIFPLLWDDTEAIAMVFDDITQQRIIMELKVADKNKDLVIAMVSHELRTPLNGMLGLMDIARKNITDPNTLFYLSACRDSGMLLLNLVNSILDMNQIKNNKLRLVYTEFNLQELCKEIKVLFNQTCRVKHLYFNIDITSDIPKLITTDKNRLSQILINLLGNAFKFTFKGGVTLRVCLENQHPCRIRFSVEDTGIGIKKEDQNQLFQMYGKIEQQDRKINTSGVGLGLTISNSLAKLLNPSDSQKVQIHVKSEVNEGTCFSFIVEPQIMEKTVATSKHEGSAGNISSLALVEDKDLSIYHKMTTYNSKENFTRKFLNSNQDIGSMNMVSPLVEARPLQTRRIDENVTLLQTAKTPTKKLNHHHYHHNLNTIKNHLSEIYEVIVKNRSPGKENQPGANYYEIEEEDRLYPREEGNWCLVVDDNPFNLMVACHIMEERGYLVKTALNGKEAISQAQEHHAIGKTFKVVLMDCQMPVMDGYEATRVLKNMMKNGEIGSYPIVALTANNRDDEHEKMCQEAGMSGHVAKPLQVHELEAVLKTVQI